MTTPLIGDASDRVIELARAPKIQGWPVERWIQFVQEHPDCTLPGGVGGAIVAYYTRPGLVTVDLLKRSV